MEFSPIAGDWRPDVLVTCNWGAIEFALANIVPLCRSLHVVDGFGPEERDSQIPRRVLTPPDRAASRAGGSALAQPRADRHGHLETAPETIRYVPNGINLAHFATDGFPALVA